MWYPPTFDCILMFRRAAVDGSPSPKPFGWSRFPLVALVAGHRVDINQLDHHGLGTRRGRDSFAALLRGARHTSLVSPFGSSTRERTVSSHSRRDAGSARMMGWWGGHWVLCSGAGADTGWWGCGLWAEHALSMLSRLALPAWCWATVRPQVRGGWSLCEGLQRSSDRTPGRRPSAPSGIPAEQELP